MKILFGTSSWGLGHATRDLVLIKALIDAGHQVTCVATGPALSVLRSELGEKVKYLDWPDMPSTLAGSTASFLVKTTASVPKILYTWFSEKKRTRNLLDNEHFDLVISDHRYGMITKKEPCFFVSHSPRYIAPWRSWFMETAMEWFMARWLAPIKKLLVPDDPEPGLAGEMAHKVRFFPQNKIEYLGLLASLNIPKEKTDDANSPRPQAKEERLDIFISISGPEPQRTKLQKIILPQLQTLPGNIVVTLGLPGGKAPKPPAGVEIYPYLNRDKQAQMMQRADLVVCRSGYTTLMELANMGKPALLIPTPGQTEQLYLADTLEKRQLYHSVRQSKLDLKNDVKKARDLPGYTPQKSTSQAAEQFIKIVMEANENV